MRRLSGGRRLSHSGSGAALPRRRRDRLATGDRAAAVAGAARTWPFCEVIAEIAALPQFRLEGWRNCGSAACRWSRTGCGCRWAAPTRSTPARVAPPRGLRRALGAPLVSEHVAFVRAGGREAGHLLPVPRTRRGARRARREHPRAPQSELDVPLAVEPIAALFDWPEDEYTEADFLTELLDRTGALLLLDVANVYANARQPRRRTRDAVLDRFPLDRVAYVHVAGGARARRALPRHAHRPGARPRCSTCSPTSSTLPGAPPPVMLERDGRYPPAARAARRAGRDRRGGRHRARAVTGARAR